MFWTQLELMSRSQAQIKVIQTHKTKHKETDLGEFAFFKVHKWKI